MQCLFGMHTGKHLMVGLVFLYAGMGFGFLCESACGIRLVIRMASQFVYNIGQPPSRSDSIFGSVLRFSFVYLVCCCPRLFFSANTDIHHVFFSSCDMVPCIVSRVVNKAVRVGERLQRQVVARLRLMGPKRGRHR